MDIVKYSTVATIYHIKDYSEEEKARIVHNRLMRGDMTYVVEVDGKLYNDFEVETEKISVECPRPNTCETCKHYDCHISVPTSYPVTTSRCTLDDKTVSQYLPACERWERK